jgi:GT2 family glycosyltransferase
MKRVVVILVDWNGEEVTRVCLASLQQALLPSGVSLSVVLVDNGSTKPLSQGLTQEYTFLSLLRSEINLGFTGGNNLGIEQALLQEPDYILFLNNDTVVKGDFLSPLLNFLDTHPHTAAVQPKIYFYPEQTRIWNAGNKFYPWVSQTGVRGYGQLDKPIEEIPQEQPWLTGCAILARASLFSGKEGLRFREKFFALYEDVDLSFRIRSKGMQLFYIPSSVIYHRAGYSSNTKVKTKEGYTHPFMVFLNSRNRIWLARLYTPVYYWPSTFLFLTVYFLLLVPYFLIRGRFTKAFSVLKAIKEGILTKPV